MMKYMKTATLTFHAPNNNGSFLQAFALQQVLMHHFCVENEIIDFCTDKQRHQYSVLRVPHSIVDIARNILSIVNYFPLKKRYNQFNFMRNKYLKLSRKCAIPEEVYCIADNYDVLICGSDQIWNTEARDFSEVYFLPNTYKKKITYGVSCGSHINDIDASEVVSQAKTFAHLSVRENAGYKFFQDHGLNNVQVVCDPTLLLMKKDYQQLYDSKNLIRGQYIFLYTINYEDEVLKLAAYLSKKYDMPVYAPFTGYSSIKCLKYGIKVLYDVAPDMFLNLIDNATYTCSNSFHGIVFSIIYEKQFFRPCVIDKQGNLIRDDRIDGLLDNLHLGERRIYENEGIILPKAEVSYAKVEEMLGTVRQQALNYLEKALND